MRVFISGASGFLGRHFLEHHRAAGDEVLAIDLVKTPNVFVIDANEFYRAETKSFQRAYHFAAVVGGRLTIEGDPLAQANNLGLDAAFFRWAIKHTEVAVYPSSSAVYGHILQENQGQPLTEDLFHPEDGSWYAPDELYGLEKLVGEFLAHKAVGYGLHTLCIRPFSGYGPGQTLDYPVPTILNRALDREDPLTVWGSGYQRRDFVHVSDIVAATVARLDSGLQGYDSMNIASGEPVSFRTVAQMAAKMAGYKPDIVGDHTKPTGPNSRFASVLKMAEHYHPRVDLEKGLTEVMESLRASRPA